MTKLGPFVLICSVLCFEASAQEYGPVLDYGVGLRIDHHSNILHRSSAGSDEGDTVFAPFIDFGLNRQGTRVDATFIGALEHLSYLDNTFSSEIQSNLTATVVWKIADDRVHWVLEDHLVRTPINILGPDNPDNTQQSNTFVTGPDFRLRLSPVDSLTIGARYTNFYAEETANAESDGSNVSLSWRRRSSERRDFGLSLETEKISFDAPEGLTAGYDRNRFTFDLSQQWNQLGAINTLAVALGFSEISFDGSREGFDSPTLKVSWDRRSSDKSRVAISLTKEIAQASDLRNVGVAVTPANIQQTAVTGDPFEREILNLTLARSWQRLNADFRAEFETQDYDIAPLDQDKMLVNVALNYRLRPLLLFKSSVGWQRQEFDLAAQDDEQFEISFGLNYQRTRNLFYELSATYTDFESTDPALDYEDKSVMASVTYRR